MHYNYVFYGATNDYLKHSLSDLARVDFARVREDFYEGDNGLLKKIFKLHTYPQFNRFVKLPFKGVWGNHCFNFEFKNDNPICFVFEAKYFSQDFFFREMRNRFPGCKFVITFRDLIRKYEKRFPDFNLETIHNKFDLVMSYDKEECKKYEMVYFNLEASKENISIAPDYPWSDVVFIGRARGRIDKIVRAYDILSDAGFNCYFYVVGEKIIKKHKGIIFTDKLLSYSEMLEKTINSRCVLELSQQDEYGFTSRSQEAIMYNKKLITDSLIVREQKFYPSNNILFINNVEEIDPNFIKGEESIDYGYTNEYSPIRVLEKIDKLI